MRQKKQRKQKLARRESLEQQLERHPKLKEQVEALVAIAENRDGTLEVADDAEWAILQQVRQLGGQTLREWAQQQADRKAAELPQLNPSACKDKKKLWWNSTLGRVRVVEQRFRHGRQGPSLRPFLVSARVSNRGYSRLLQRAITDFGADVAFEHIPKKVKEHYGIEVAGNAAREITEKQGARMLEQESLQTQIPDQPGVAVVVAELDGSMIPVVRTAEPEPGLDRRTTRQLEWQEARLALAYRQGSVTPRFGATLGGPEQAGAQWADCVIRSGAGRQTLLHCLGDGATWIAEQAEQRFGTQARYLIDFYHLSEYLGAAARVADQPQAWLEQQKQHLKQNRSDAVLDALAPHLERHKATADKPAPVQACYRYIHNRPGQFDYHSALAAGLPIGSGEVESAHRYVIQARLKLAGAWWKEDNAAKMLALRIVRANNEWEAYWHNSHPKAA